MGVIVDRRPESAPCLVRALPWGIRPRRQNSDNDPGDLQPHRALKAPVSAHTWLSHPRTDLHEPLTCLVFIFQSLPAKEEETIFLTKG